MSRWRRRLLAAQLMVLLPGTLGAAGRIERDLSYGPDPRQRLDLSLPSGKGFSTVIFVHGGSLNSGDKADEDYRAVCQSFPGAGMACANVNYRLSPAAVWPAPADDVAAAVAWVRTNVGARGGDPSELFLMGHSSGAMLVALVGTDERYLAGAGLKPTDLRGVVPMGSIMRDAELDEALSTHGRRRVEAAFRRDASNDMYASLDAYLDQWATRHVRPGLPPFMFLIAESEQEHPPVLKTDEEFVEKARELGDWAECRVLPGRTHYSAVRRFSEPGDPTFIVVRDFIRRFTSTGRQAP